MKGAPWSRVRGQNSGYKEFLEIVGNGNPTGSVLKETIAVSATISISLEKLHHQIRLQILSCSRMSEKHREPEVPAEEVPVVECLGGHARITSKELAPIHTVKSGTLQNACSTRPRVVVGLVKSALMYIARLMNSRSKRSKKNDDKSAVAMLKKNELHDRTGQPVVCRDTRRAQGDGPVVYSSSSARQLDCVFQDMEPPKLSSI